MGTFRYSSHNMRRALFAECQKDFEALKTEVENDATDRFRVGVQAIVAKWGLIMEEQESDADRTLDIRITIIEPPVGDREGG